MGLFIDTNEKVPIFLNIPFAIKMRYFNKLM